MGRLPRLAEPRSYDLRLRVDPRKDRFSGEAVIQLDVAAPTNRLYVHALNMVELTATAEQGGRTLAATIEEAKGAGIIPNTGEQVLSFDETLAPGPAILRFRYQAPFDNRLSGLYRAQEKGLWYAYTQFEASDARRAFPCLDEPGWKVPFRVSLTVPEEDGAFANTPEASRRTEQGWTTVVFEETPPLPTYLVAFAVGPFEVVVGPREPVPIRGLAAAGKGKLLARSLEMHAEIIRVLEEYFGRPFPYKKLDTVACLEFSAGAMENPGLITYREELLLVEPGTTSESRRRRIAAVIAHELAHHWFGDLVTMAWWDDLWLNEAFAEWMAGKAVDTRWPDQDRRLSQLAGRDSVLWTDARATARPVRGRDYNPRTEIELFGVATTKGSALLTMLERLVGEDVFRDGVRRYIDAHAHGNAVSDDLFAALEAASGKELRAIARSFLDRPGVPLVSVDWTCPTGGPPTVTLAQTRYRPLASRIPDGFPEGGPWTIPVCLAYPVGPKAGASFDPGSKTPASQAVRTRCTVLAETSATMTLDDAGGVCPAWIHPNAGEYGYYRWSEPAEAVRALGSAVLQPWVDAGASTTAKRGEHAEAGGREPAPEEAREAGLSAASYDVDGHAARGGQARAGGRCAADEDEAENCGPRTGIAEPAAARASGPDASHDGGIATQVSASANHASSNSHGANGVASSGGSNVGNGVVSSGGFSNVGNGVVSSGAKPAMLEMEHIVVRSRLGLIDQAWSMVSAGRLDPTAFTTVLEQMATVEDRRVTERVLEGIDRIANTWEDVAATPGFHAYVRRLIGPRTEKLGWDRKPGEDAEIGLLRPTLLTTLGKHGRAQWVLDGAEARAKAYLDDPQSVAPEVSAVALTLAASEGKVKVRKVEKLLRGEGAPSRRVNALAALGAMPPGKDLDRALALGLTDTVRQQDLYTIWTGALDRSAARAQAFTFMMAHFDDLTRRATTFGGSRGSTYARQISVLCTEEEKDRVVAFFRSKGTAEDDRSLVRGIETADQCIAIRKHGRDAVAAYFAPGASPAPPRASGAAARGSAAH